MTKQNGLGDNLYVAGYDLSGDVGTVTRVGGGPELLDVTTISKLAYERLTGKKSGSIEFATFFDDATNAEHDALKGLPRTDVIATYTRGTTLGGVAASCIGKQVNYDWNRANDGGLTGAVQVLSNGYGIEWGRQLTAGLRTDTSATNGSSIDTTASASFGGQAYLQVFSFTGTSVTVKIQDSADNSAWSDVTSFAFTAATGRTTQRIQLGSTATIRRYVRAVTTGTFSSAVFHVNLIKNAATVSF